MLFACLAGFVPYTCDTGDEEAILEQIAEWEKIEFPGWFSEGVRDLLTRALEKDPVKRIDMKGMRDHTWTKGVGLEEESSREKGRRELGSENGGWGNGMGSGGWSPVTPGEGRRGEWNRKEEGSA